MKCERALEILNSIKDKKDILTSYEEISELNEYHLISEFKSNIPKTSRKNGLTGLRRKYLQMSNDIRQAYQNLVTLEGEYNHLSTISRFFTHLKIGSGARLKRDISDLHQFIKNKEIDLKKLKWDLLKLNTEIESYERAVKVNGIRVFLTPIGETMIDEI